MFLYLNKVGVVIFGILLFTSCDSAKEKKLVGHWKAAEITEDGMPLKTDLEPLNFWFSDNCYFKYESTLEYKEEGTYYVNGSLLYTLDTINEASSEKAVKIDLLSHDSLFLRMNAEGKDKLMKLYKVK